MVSDMVWSDDLHQRVMRLVEQADKADDDLELSEDEELAWDADAYYRALATWDADEVRRLGAEAVVQIILDRRVYAGGGR